MSSQKRAIKPIPSQKCLRDIFDYHKDGFLIRKSSKTLCTKNGTSSQVEVRVNGTPYKTCRLIWVWHFGELLPKQKVNHINGNRNDNRIDNLKLVVSPGGRPVKSTFCYGMDTPFILAKDEVLKRFSYDDGYLVLRFDSEQMKAGDKLTYIGKKGYIAVSIDRKAWDVHRLIWVMFNGDIPSGMQIDHINGVRNDNRIENLRLVSPSINQRNRRKAKNNTSGFTGVTRNYKKWTAKTTINGVVHHLGSFETKEVAARYVSEFRRANAFTERHGV